MQDQRSGSVGSVSFWTFWIPIQSSEVQIWILGFYSFVTSFMTVYLQRMMLLFRVPSKSNKQKPYFFLASWRSLRLSYGSGTADPFLWLTDPYSALLVTDPEHWLLEARWVRLEVLFICRDKKSILRNRTLTFCKPQVRQLHNVQLLAESAWTSADHLTWPPFGWIFTTDETRENRQ